MGSLDEVKKNPAGMKLFSYHPDLPVIRKNYAKYAEAVENMDRKVQQAIDAPSKRMACTKTQSLSTTRTTVA